MNDDDLEKKLHALTGALQRPDPTPAWKADILARARREAIVTPLMRALPPRWLMLGWAAAWMAIFYLNFSAPQNTAPHTARNSPNPVRKPIPQDNTSPQFDPSALIVFHRQQTLTHNLSQ